MKTLSEILALSTQYLEERKISRARREAEDLLCDALSTTRMELYTDSERPLTQPELDLCRSRLARRGNREPLAYIHGSQKFFDCDIIVTPDVLIPRQETEVLVDKIAATLESLDLEGKTLWDVCTGSGCIGIALKKRFPQLQVELSDVSSAAAQIARENATRNAVDVQVHEGDLLAPFVGRHCDFFVCNPPYVTETEYASLEPEVRDHEPKGALVTEDQGLALYRRLAQELRGHLRPGGRAWFELGTGQGEAIQALFAQDPWRKLKIDCDWAGHERFFSLENE